MYTYKYKPNSIVFSIVSCHLSIGGQSDISPYGFIINIWSAFLIKLYFMLDNDYERKCCKNTTNIVNSFSWFDSSMLWCGVILYKFTTSFNRLILVQE